MTEPIGLDFQPIALLQTFRYVSFHAQRAIGQSYGTTDLHQVLIARDFAFDMAPCRGSKE